MGERYSIAIDIGRRSVRAVHAAPSRDGVKIRRAMVAEIPTELRGAEPEALGQWIAERLREAQIPRGRAIVGLARELVGVKRMHLPSVDPAELPDMTRLAWQRDGAMDASGMVIDFVPQERTQTGTTVLAVAVPCSALDAMRKTFAAAGLGIGRIALTVEGAATLVALDHDKPGGTSEPGDDRRETAGGMLLIDVTGESIELTVIVNGAIRFSRAAELPASSDLASLADVVMTETRRTWTSYRTAEDAVDVSAAVILGDPRLGQLTSAALMETLKVQPRVMERHPCVDRGSMEIQALWPLAGLLMDDHRTMAGPIDLNAPRRAPDLAARKRKRRLLATAAVLIGCGVIYTLGNMSLKSLRAHAASLSAQQTGGALEYDMYRRAAAKLEHLHQWQTSEIDWLRHANYLMRFSPPPDQMVLDSWNASIEPIDVKYDSKTRTWSTQRKVTIVVEGEARDRETADAFREALVKKSKYETRSTGVDARGGKRLPFGFTYRLRIDGELPAEPTRTDAPPAKGDSSGAPTDARPATP